MQPMIKSFPTPRGVIIIREANLSDVEQFRALRLFALQDSPTAFSSDYQINFNHPTSFWENRLRPDPNGTIFFSENNSGIIGMTGIRRGESPKTKHSAEVWGVFVRPEWRGVHLAGEMIEMCCAWAKSRDVEIVKLAVVAINSSAIHCYERCGFKKYGIEPRALLFDGVYYDELLMSRSLHDS
jgi:RimJ/RimL family protein N-acetyltransferase